MIHSDIEKLFQTAKEDILCNTSYPINPKYFSKYRSNADIMEDTKELSFYFHIPFCRQLCKFCEYTRFLSGDYGKEKEYIEKLKRQTEKYLSSHKVKKLYGLDIGGGTPSVLHSDIFEELLYFISQVRNSLPLKDGFESSIEFSFSAIDKEKIALMSKYGFQRMSTGIQVYDKGLLEENNRGSHSISEMKKVSEEIHKSGIKKLNIDIMYGLGKQTEEMLRNTLEAIEIIHPEQVTVYETRYNINRLEHIKIDRELLFEQYCYLYERLTKMGYRAKFGQNTFSVYEDEGVSSYLHSRMFDGVPYKGFGISAQSMSRKGISYNILKSCMESHIPNYTEITEGDIYLLPKDETAAKYVCVGLYSGQFSLKVLTDILGISAYSFYYSELEFLKEYNLITIEDDICRLTKEGFKIYGAAASLFWSDNHKMQYMLDKQKERKQ